MPAFGGATGQSLLGVREPLAARHYPVREARKQVGRWNLAPACASLDRRASRSSVPSPIPRSGRARAHSSAPAGSAQSAPRDLRERCRQGLIQSEVELRLPLTGASKGAVARTPSRIPGGLRKESSALHARAGRGRATSVPAPRPPASPDSSALRIPAGTTVALRVYPPPERGA